MAKKGSGWKNESRRHSLARKGIKTVQSDGVDKTLFKKYKQKQKEFDSEFQDREYEESFHKDIEEIKERLNSGGDVLIHTDYKEIYNYFKNDPSLTISPIKSGIRHHISTDLLPHIAHTFIIQSPNGKMVFVSDYHYDIYEDMGW